MAAVRFKVSLNQTQRRLEMPRRGENIYKRKDGRWEGRCITGHNENGHATFQYFYGHSYGEVKEKLLTRYQKVKMDTKRQHGIYYSDILDAWLRNKYLSVKESSYGKYQHTVDYYIRPQLGGCRARDLSTAVIESYIGNLLSSGRQNGQGLSPKTVQDILVIIKDTVSFALIHGMQLPCKLERLFVKQKTSEIRVFTQEEQRKLTVFLMNDMNINKLCMLLCLYTGLRIGEVCALRWDCVDLDKRALRVRATVQRVRLQDPGDGPKTKMLYSEPMSKTSIRDIPLPEQLLPILRQFQGDPSAFILSGAADQYPEPRLLQYWFKKYLVQCGIEDANFHALRHTFATRCVESGFELKSLSEILGHANVNVTLNRYVHSSFALKAENMGRMVLLM